MDENEAMYLFRRGKSGSNQPTWRCPNETQLAAYVDQQLTGEVKDRVEAHVADCAYCLDQVVFLLRTEGKESPEEVPEILLARARALVEAQTHSPLRPVWQWGSIAAVTASLVVATALWLRPPQPASAPSPPAVVSPGPTSTPGASSTVAPPASSLAVRNGQKKVLLPELLVPREGAVIARREFELRWKEVPRAVFYEIRLVTAEGDLVWEGRAERTYTRLPSQIPLTAGQKYFVWVRAYLPEGKTVQSKAVAFKAADNS